MRHFSAPHFETRFSGKRKRLKTQSPEDGHDIAVPELEMLGHRQFIGRASAQCKRAINPRLTTLFPDSIAAEGLLPRGLKRSRTRRAHPFLLRDEAIQAIGSGHRPRPVLSACR